MRLRWCLCWCSLSKSCASRRLTEEASDFFVISWYPDEGLELFCLRPKHVMKLSDHKTVGERVAVLTLRKVRCCATARSAAPQWPKKVATDLLLPLRERIIGLFFSLWVFRSDLRRSHNLSHFYLNSWLIINPSFVINHLFICFKESETQLCVFVVSVPDWTFLNLLSFQMKHECCCFVLFFLLLCSFNENFIYAPDGNRLSYFLVSSVWSCDSVIFSFRLYVW